MFEKRETGIGVIFVGNPQLKKHVTGGDRVVLRIGSESVLIKDVQVLGGSRFRGEVYGFEPGFSSAYAGLQVGNTIDFDESNVISCGS